jgi:hypothetical protein
MKEIAPNLYDIPDCPHDCFRTTCPVTCSEVQRRLAPAPVEYWVGGDVATMTRGD